MTRQELLDALLTQVSQTCGRGWWAKNKETISTGFGTILTDAFITGQDAVTKQLTESLDALQKIDVEYQRAFEALRNSAEVAVGRDELLKMLPLTIEKLEAIIIDALTQAVAAHAPTDWITKWIETHQRNLTQVGMGPLAMGRYEGSKDLLTQLAHAAKANR